jgi:alkylation response protein AidB-like acyl-CoA dehydrogenase
MQNKVLDENYRLSKNYYLSDIILQHYLNTRLSVRSLAGFSENLCNLGDKAAGDLNRLSQLADKLGPELRKRDFYGEKIDEIDFHPAYGEMLEIAVESQMFRLKWEPELRQKYLGERHKMGFASGFLFAMSESSLYCPLCMTDGVALLIDRYCNEADKKRLLPRIYTDKASELFTGAMFLTEKSGGSDVGANQLTATHFKEDFWYLNGEKWFCSNANADIIFVLARTRQDISGTKGLGIFLLEPKQSNESSKGMDLIRLKDKLGTRSMASGEYLFNNVIAKLIGGETEGFKIMTDMINLSRLYNSVAAIAGMRRAIIESYQFLSFRNSFGKNILEHALVRLKFHELGSIYLGNFYLSWRAIEALDAAETGDAEEAELLRVLTPMTKKSTAETSVYAVREAMELMGGMGYIEDGAMPKIMRDMMVLPIWEGAGNIMILDMLRASSKSKGLDILFKELETAFEEISERDVENREQWQRILIQIMSLKALIAQLQKESQDIMESTAKFAFDKLVKFYQLGCLLRYYDEDSSKWIQPALKFYVEMLGNSQENALRIAPTLEEVNNLLAWDF